MKSTTLGGAGAALEPSPPQQSSEPGGLVQIADVCLPQVLRLSEQCAWRHTNVCQAPTQHFSAFRSLSVPAKV